MRAGRPRCGGCRTGRRRPPGWPAVTANSSGTSESSPRARVTARAAGGEAEADAEQRRRHLSRWCRGRGRAGRSRPFPGGAAVLPRLQSDDGHRVGRVAAQAGLEGGEQADIGHGADRARRRRNGGARRRTPRRPSASPAARRADRARGRSTPAGRPVGLCRHSDAHVGTARAGRAASTAQAGPSSRHDAPQVRRRGADQVDPRVEVVDPVDRDLVDAQPDALGGDQELGVEEPFLVLDQGEELGRRLAAHGLEPALGVGARGCGGRIGAAGCSRGR